MLLQTILLMFGLLALAAAVVDLGFARVAQVQMQAGVDTAALEVLRSRDSSGSGANRHNARLYAWNTYVDPANQRLVGAGADLTLTGGEPGRNGMQTISVGADPVYRPCLALNLSNAPNGDVVTGKVKPAGTRPMDYADDFTRYIDPGDGTDSVLVRMRRTGYRPEGGPDTPQSDPNCNSETATTSAGPGVPLLFGLGSTIQPNASGYSVRQHGVTVRATAVADSRPVRRIAAAYAAPLAISRDFWEGTSNGSGYTLTSSGGGIVTVAGTGTEIGFSWGTGAPPTRIGDTINAGGRAPAASGPRYVPIYVRYRGDRVVIGFGYASVVSDGAGDISSFVPVHRRMADAGASALAAEGLSGSATDIAYVSSQNASLGTALMAPSLLR